MSNAKKSHPFPREGVFPSIEECREQIEKNLRVLNISAHALSLKLPGRTNPNMVKEIATGKNENPTHETLYAVFATLEDLRQEHFARARETFPDQDSTERGAG